MATLTSPGISSGLDVKSIVSQLVAVERLPINALKSQAATIESRLSSFGLLQSYTDNVRDVAEKLARPEFWTQTIATSSDAASVTVSAAPGTAAASYAVEVSRLASAQTVASGAFADSSSAVGEGTLTIEFGRWNADQTSFSAEPSRTALVIPISVPDNSVDAIKAKINAANSGVTASVVRDASGARLVLRSLTTGEVSAMRITTVDTGDANSGDALGLSALNFDPPTAVAGQATQVQAAGDAAARVNGIDLVSSTNTLTNVLDGLTLTLGKVTTAPVSVSVALDTASQRKAIGELAKAYSELDGYINAQTKYDPATKKAAILQGDGSTRAIQNSVRDMFRDPSGASTRFARLSDIGLELQTDGSLKLNESKLSSALATPTELANLFSAKSLGNPELAGFATRIKERGDLLLAADGPLASRSKSLRSSVTRNQTEQDRLEARVAVIEARLNKQYSALDTTLSKINAQNASLTQSIAAWTASLSQK